MFVLCFPLSFSVFYYVSLCFFFLFFFMFSPSLFKLLHLQSKKNTYKNRTQHKHSKENIKQTEKPKYPSQTLRDIYFSRRFVGWKSCISVFVYVFLRVVLFLCLFLSVLFYVFA